MEVFNQRLEDEFNIKVVITTPSVPYIIEYENGNILKISDISQWPIAGRNIYFKIKEPMVNVILVSPKEYYGNMTNIIKERRGLNIQVNYLEDGNVLINAMVPWQEVACDMHDSVKHNSSGYASFNYEEAGYMEADLVKVEIVVNGEVCEPLSFIVHSDKAVENGRKIALKLKDVLTRQQFEIIIQARIGLKVYL